MAEAQHQQLPAVICHACEETKPLVDVCFDMDGCPHLVCFECLSRRGSAGDGAVGGVVACPVPGCVEGFLDQQSWEEEEEDEEDEVEVDDDRAEGEVEEEPPTDAFFCSICMEQKPLPEGFFGTSGCDHVFCAECIGGYVEAKVQENLVAIGCPDPECKAGKLEPEACRGVVPPAVFDRWGAALCETAVGAQAMFYCPYRDCSVLLANEGDEEGRPMTESQCLHCGRTCCAQCRVPWHRGLTCEAYRKKAAAEEEELARLMELAKISRWQKCPKCGFMVDRVDGCVFIRCRCQHCFCYRCASPMDSEDRRHFCENCHLTWDKEN